MRIGEEAICRPYMRALLACAKDATEKSKLTEELQQCRAIVEDAKVHRYLSNPIRSPKQRLDGFKQLLSQSVDLTPITLRLVDALAKAGRLLLIPSLAQLYQRELRQEGGMVDVQVEMALDMDDQGKKQVEAWLSQMLEGSSFTFEYSLQPELQTGFRARSQGRIIDTCGRTRLENLRKSLARA